MQAAAGSRLLAYASLLGLHMFFLYHMYVYLHSELACSLLHEVHLHLLMQLVSKGQQFTWGTSAAADEGGGS